MEYNKVYFQNIKCNPENNKMKFNANNYIYRLMYSNN